MTPGGSWTRPLTMWGIKGRAKAEWMWRRDCVQAAVTQLTAALTPPSAFMLLCSEPRWLLSWVCQSYLIAMSVLCEHVIATQMPRISHIAVCFTYISAKCAYRIYFPHKLAFSTAILILFVFLLPIFIRFCTFVILTCKFEFAHCRHQGSVKVCSSI